MKTSHVSSLIRNRIWWLIYIIAIACGASQAFAQQTSSRLSRFGVQAHAPQPGAQQPASHRQGEHSPLYTFTFGVIAFPRSQISVLCGINDSGRMVGGYNNTELEIYTADHGYQLKGNTFSTIDYPGAQQTEVEAINKSGQMVGDFLDASGNQHGFKLAGGTYTQLDYPGTTTGTVALGINASGEIVGIYENPNQTGFLLSGGTYTSIAVPGAVLTYAEGINKHGVIAGYYFDTSGNSHGFTWDKGTITTIDYGNGYPNTYLAGIDDSGVIVGGYGSWMTVGSISYPWEHGFLYSGGTFSTFDAPFGDDVITSPFGMNNNGEVVGTYVDSQGMNYGFYLKAQ
jgi:uncharacterized membrane protein